MKTDSQKLNSFKMLVINQSIKVLRLKREKIVMSYRIQEKIPLKKINR